MQLSNLVTRTNPIWDYDLYTLSSSEIEKRENMENEMRMSLFVGIIVQRLLYNTNCNTIATKIFN